MFTITKGKEQRPLTKDEAKIFIGIKNLLPADRFQIGPIDFTLQLDWLEFLVMERCVVVNWTDGKIREPQIYHDPFSTMHLLCCVLWDYHE